VSSPGFRNLADGSTGTEKMIEPELGKAANEIHLAYPVSQDSPSFLPGLKDACQHPGKTRRKAKLKL
jgi:hypothetical protein